MLKLAEANTRQRCSLPIPGEYVLEMRDFADRSGPSNAIWVNPHKLL